LAQGKIEDRAVFREPLWPLGARDCGEAEFDEIAQRHLRGSLAVRRADAPKHRIAQDRAARQRTIGRNRDPQAPARCDHARLIEIGMHLDLIGDERLTRKRYRLLDQRDGEVGDADMARAAIALDPRQRAKRIGERYFRIRPVDQQEVEGRHAELAETLIDRAFKVARRQAVVPYLGDEKNLLALDPGGGEPLPDLALIAVHLRGIEMAIAVPQRRADDIDAGCVPELHGSQSKDRDGGAGGASDGLVQCLQSTFANLRNQHITLEKLNRISFAIASIRSRPSRQSMCARRNLIFRHPTVMSIRQS